MSSTPRLLVLVSTLALLSLCGAETAAAGAGPEDDEKYTMHEEEIEGKELEDAFLKTDPQQALSFVASYDGKAANIIADPSINRWTEKGGKPEVLGEQEVRGLLHKAGVAGDGPRAFAIRGLLAPALIKILDGDGDGKLGAAELQAGLSTVPCVVPDYQLQLEKLEAAGTALLDGPAASSLDSMLADARACPGAQQLWDLWAARATAIEQTTLPPLGQPPTECEAGLVKLLLPNGKPQGRAALRRGLTRVLGKDAPLPIRHLLAAGLLAAADADADGRLSTDEARRRAAPVCAAAHDLRQAGSSAAEGLAAVLLAKRWTMGKTAEAAVGQEAAALLARPLRSLSLDEAITVGLAFVKHAASDKGSKEEL